MKSFFSISILAAIWMATCTFASAQTWFPPENMTNNVGIFDQKPSLDIGPAPNLSGEAAHLAQLVHESKDAGEHQVLWDGRAQNGQGVASGAYPARLRTGRISSTIKMVKIQ